MKRKQIKWLRKMRRLTMLISEQKNRITKGYFYKGYQLFRIKSRITMRKLRRIHPMPYPKFWLKQEYEQYKRFQK